MVKQLSPKQLMIWVRFPQLLIIGNLVSGKETPWGRAAADKSSVGQTEGVGLEDL